jgi:hypothetical protein
MNHQPLVQAEESKEVSSLCTLLEDRAHYHQNAVTPAQLAAVLKTLSWPVKYMLPGELEVWSSLIVPIQIIDLSRFDLHRR